MIHVGDKAAAPKVWDSSKYIGCTRRWFDGAKWQPGDIDPGGGLPPPSQGIIFSDDFSSGNFNHAVGDAYWNDTTSGIVIAASPTDAGNLAAKFSFNPVNVNRELRFDLGDLFTELWIKYDLFIPLNYFASFGISENGNNKIIRLWGNEYGDWDKVGFSTYVKFPGQTHTYAQVDWDFTNTGAIGAFGPIAPDFIEQADAGTWMTIKIHAKAATLSANGTFNVWKNGVKVLDTTSIIDNYWPSGTHAYRYGYLMGWANSSIAQTTDFYIDNVIIGTTEAAVDGGGFIPV
jgi:hypothetical protein